MSHEIERDKRLKPVVERLAVKLMDKHSTTMTPAEMTFVASKGRGLDLAKAFEELNRIDSANNGRKK